MTSFTATVTNPTITVAAGTVMRFNYFQGGAGGEPVGTLGFPLSIRQAGGGSVDCLANSPVENFRSNPPNL